MMVLQCVVMLSQDSFYRGLTEEELADVGCKLPGRYRLAKQSANNLSPVAAVNKICLTQVSLFS